MSITESKRQALAGMHKIEREIINRVRERTGPIAPAVFMWNNGHGILVDLPPAVPMAVRIGTRSTSADWPQVCLRNPWDSIDGFDVRAEIERIVAVLTAGS